MKTIASILFFLVLFLGATSLTTAISTDTSDLSHLSDDFDEAEIDPSWNYFQRGLMDLGIWGESLRADSTSRSMWFNERSGPLMYKSVSGDFSMTSRVHVRLQSNPNFPPFDSFRFGGLMIRDPRSTIGNENYVFSVLGNRGDYLAAETKTTINGTSQVQGPSWYGGDIDIRLCRVGNTIKLYNKRVDENAWNFVRDYTRSDFQDELQAGLIIYDDGYLVDLRVIFDYIKYDRVFDESDCTKQDSQGNNPFDLDEDGDVDYVDIKIFVALFVARGYDIFDYNEIVRNM